MTGKDAVRFLVGQTSSGDPVIIANEEINWTIGQTGNVYCAAAQVAEGMLAQYASKTVGADSRTVGNLSITNGDRVAKLQSLLSSLRAKCAMRSAVPVAGGILVSDFQARVADTSLTPPQFAVGMDDFIPGAANDPSSGWG